MIDFQKLAIDVFTELALDGNMVGVHFDSDCAVITCNEVDYKIPNDTSLGVADWVGKIEGMSDGKG